MRTPHDLPADLGPAFSTRAALARGVPKTRLERQDLAHPFHAVHTRGEPATLDALCRAYLERAGDDEFFSHATAALLWGMDLPRFLQERRELDVSVLRPAHPPQAAGIIGHRLQRRLRVVTLRGLPVVQPVEAWIELASILDVEELIEVGDALVRRVHPLAHLPELFAAVQRAKGVRGVWKLRQAVGEVREGTDARPETTVRRILVRAGLPEPVVGYEVKDCDRIVGTPDLAYPFARLALEYEGDVHRTDLRTFRKDIERREAFHDVDWRVIRVTGDHLRDSDRLIRRVERALNGSGHSPG